jgi:hypothetical protein
VRCTWKYLHAIAARCLAWIMTNSEVEQVASATQDAVWARVSVAPAGRPAALLCVVARGWGSGVFSCFASDRFLRKRRRALHHWRVGCIRPHT